MGYAHRVVLLLAAVQASVQLVFPGQSLASPIPTFFDPREMVLASQSLIVDVEASIFAGFVGDDLSSVLLYGADIGPNGWSGQLSGTYLGSPLAVSYSGTAGFNATHTTFGGTYDSQGCWGQVVVSVCVGTPWLGHGDWLIVDDPTLKYGAAIDPNTKSAKLTVGVNSGIWSASANVTKDTTAKQFSAEVSGGVLQGVAAVGGNFTYQQGTGSDSSQVFFSLLWGLLKRSKTVDKTQLFTPKDSATVPPLPSDPGPVAPNVPTPEAPPLNTDLLGFDQADPNRHGREYMYVYGVPSPASGVLLASGFVALLALATRFGGRKS